MLLPGAVVPGMVLGGFEGVPGVACASDGFGVMPGTEPDLLLTAEQGGRLGVCDPGVAPGFVMPGVLATPGCVVPGVEFVSGVEGDDGVCDGLACPGVWPPGVEVDGLGLCVAELLGELELCATANAATPKAQLKNMLEKTLFLLILSPFSSCWY